MQKVFSYQVLDGVNLDAAPGEVVSLIGASGSRKSTLMRCINFLEMPDQEGKVVIDNESVLDETAA